MPTSFAIMAEFDTPAAILRAAEKVRQNGYRQWDVFTPFPVHGMDSAMGIKNSKVGWFSFIGGCTGYATGMIMIWFMNAYDYRIVIGGKPMFSPFSAFLNRLPRLHHPLLKNRRFALATHDRFFVVIESSDPKYSENETRRLLESIGSKHIELVEE
jgi:hypothetical protein